MSEYAKAEAPYIRARLEALRAQIEGVGHGSSIGFWKGDTAGERQTRDDLASGRFFWETAWKHTCSGLEAADASQYDLALTYLLEAQACAIEALGARLRPDDLAQLAKPAKPRGRRRAT